MTNEPSTPHDGADAEVVRFFEIAGADARGLLEPLAAAWRAAGAATDLLASLDRDDLWLLVVRGGRAGEVVARPAPSVRTWRFRSVTP